MIEHAWTVVCKKAIVDPQTNNATLVEIVEQINSTQRVIFPTVAPVQMELVTLWYRSNIDTPEHGEGRIVFIGPDGREAGPPQVFPIDLTQGARLRTIAQLPGIPLVGEGVHYFQIELRADGQAQWRSVARIPVTFVMNQPVAQPAAEPVH
jgi:hypothetical protein